jgi:hypothetical protein
MGLDCIQIFIFYFSWSYSYLIQYYVISEVQIALLINQRVY